MSIEPQIKPPKKLNYREKCLAGLVSKKPRKALAKPKEVKLRKTKLKPVSAKQASWNSKYHQQIATDAQAQSCFRCGIQGDKESLDRHHTHGRTKEKILRYEYCCRPCHDWIHGNPKLAREQGFLNF